MWFAFFLVAGLLLVASNAAALEGSNFSLSEYFPGTNYTKLQYKLSAAQARSLPGNRQLLTNVKLQAFKLTGELELVIEVPECVYDQTNKTVGSPGPLQVQSGDGRFRIAGDGFLYRQGESRVVISNRVHATVTLPTTNSAGPLEITSRWFEFDKDRSRGVFHDEVHGGDADFDFTCSQLSVSAVTNQLVAATNRMAFDLVEANGDFNVIGKTGGKQAGRKISAQRGVYRRNEGILELIGETKWQLEDDGRSGRSDRITAWQTNRTIEALGDVALKSPRELLGAAGGMLTASNSPMAKPGRSALIELFADRCTFRTNGNEFIAEGGVRLLDRTNQLTCDRLETREGSSSALGKIASATGHVIVSRAGSSIVAERADYAETDGALVFTGEPRWRIEQNTGAAERLTVRTRAGEVLAENNVRVIVPLGPGTGSFLNLLPGEAVTNSAPAVIEVSAQNFLVRTNGRRVTFSGAVRVHQLPKTGSEPRLQSEEMELRFSTNSPPRVERLEARQNVIFEQGTPGETNRAAIYRRMTARTIVAATDLATDKLREVVADGDVKIEEPGTQATGDRAVYTTATDTFKLTGKTVLETPQVIFTESPEVYWSRAEKRFVAREPCVIKVKSEALKRAGESQKLP